MTSALHRLEVVLRRALGFLVAALFWRPGRRRLRRLLADATRVVLVRIDDRVGEALLVTPLVKALSGRYQVELVLHPRCLRALEGLPGVTALHPFERRWLRWGPFSAPVVALRQMTKGAVVVNCASWTEYSGTAAIVARLLAPRAVVVGPAIAPASWLADVVVAPRADTRREVAQRLHYLTPLLGSVADAPLAFRAPRPSEAVREFASGLACPHVVVNPGGRLDERRVSASVFAAGCRAVLALGKVPVVTWGPGEEPLARAVCAEAVGAVLAPATGLDELAFLMQGARAVVCNNTGPMHLAVAVGTPTLALFFRMPADRWGHHFPPHRVLDLTEVPPAEQGAALERALTEVLANPSAARAPRE